MSVLSHERRARGGFVPLLAVVALAAAARLAVVGRDALWIDEGYSWWDARQPLAALWDAVPTCDPHPPLYFALLHGWAAVFGDSTVALRSLSVAFGCAAVAFVYLAARELELVRGAPRSRFGLPALAALLFALTPFQIYFAVEARPYALLCAAAAAATWGALRVVRLVSPKLQRGFTRFGDRGGARLGWTLVVLGTATALWTHNTAVLFAASLGLYFAALFVVDRDSRRAVRSALIAAAATALLWAPDLPLLWSQLGEVAGEFWIPPPSFGHLQHELHYAVGLDRHELTWWMVAVMAAGCVLIGRRRSWAMAALVAALAVLPIASNVVASALLSPVLIARALIVATPAFAIAVAAAASLVAPGRLRSAAVLVLVAVHVAACVPFFTADHVKEPWRRVVADIASRAPGIPILVVPNELALPLAHAARESGSPIGTMHGVPADYPAIGLPLRYPSGKCAPSAAAWEAASLPADVAASPSLVLVTRRRNTYDPDDGVIAALQARGFAIASDETHQPGDLRVLRFARGPEPTR